MEKALGQCVNTLGIAPRASKVSNKKGFQRHQEHQLESGARCASSGNQFIGIVFASFYSLSMLFSGSPEGRATAEGNSEASSRRHEEDSGTKTA